MGERTKSRFWRRCRIVFRRFRIGIWCVIAVLLAGVLYLDQVGLPDFVKRPLQEKLRARGLDVEFTRMRWRWNRGIVAENLEFGGTRGESQPRFSVREARLHIDLQELARFRLQVKGIHLRAGELHWAVTGTNQPDRDLSVSNITTELRLLPGDRWELDDFQAEFAGAKIELGGVITNASAIRQWAGLRGGTPPAPGSVERRLRRVIETMDRIHFSTPPELKVDVRGDARDLQSFIVRLNLDTPGAETPWGAVQNAFLAATLFPASSNAPNRAEIHLTAGRAQTKWAGGTNLVARIVLASKEERFTQIEGDLNVSVSEPDTPWGGAASAQFTAHWLQSVDDPIPISGTGQLHVVEARTQWGVASEAQGSVNLLPPSGATPESSPSWAWWSAIARYPLNWECNIRGLTSPKFSAQSVSCAGEWKAPLLRIDSISGTLYGGTCHAQASLDVASRRFAFSAASDFDPHRISPLLTEKSRDWLAQFSWTAPPQIIAEGSMILPAWTNRQPDWRGEVRPGIALRGNFKVGDGSFRGIEFLSAESHFGYTNLHWSLPDLVAIRPEGRVELEHVSNEATRDYYFHINSTADPRAVRPLLEPEQQRGFDLVGLTQPPVIDAEIWGRWYAHDLIGFRATVAATNLSVRSEWASNVVARLEYTNRFLKVIEPRLTRGREHAEAAGVGLDFVQHKVYLTNATGFMDPGAVTRAIGPHVAEHMKPYRFLAPVTARVRGTIPMRDVRDAELHFELEGGPFEWWNIQVPTISGRVDWLGERLELNNIQAGFYGGFAVGDAEFDFTQGDGIGFRFDVAATDTDLHSLVAGLSGKTNRLEGRLTARVSITNGDSKNPHALQGSGRASLNDGLLWDIPVFGVLSPALDSIVPGLGSSRAREAEATFVVTNGVIHSDDLEIRASGMRLQYAGDVTLDGWVNARVQAELLRDMWGVGRLVSLALWPVSKIFEYKLSGSLHEPKSEPVFFIPRIVLMPFHPLRTVRDLVPGPQPDKDSNDPGGASSH